MTRRQQSYARSAARLSGSASKPDDVEHLVAFGDRHRAKITIYLSEVAEILAGLPALFAGLRAVARPGVRLELEKGRI
jgi:hypothetical protein